jgi:cyclic-di-GMP phosphodiesterase TipF (flagellum assembly factor)
MARKLGLRSAGQTLLFILGAALLFAAPFALEATGQIDEATLGLALAAIAFSAAALAMLRSGQAAEAAKRSAGEAEALSQRLLPVLDTLSQRLLRLESRLTYQAAGEGAPRLEATVAEVSSEISVLGQLVRDLAVALAAQDRDVAVLKDQVTRVAGPGLAPRVTASAPPPVAPPRPSEKLVTPTLFPMPEPAPPVVAPARHDDEDAAEEARRIAAVAEAFEADRIELHLQPVVGLPQRKIRMYEVLSRLRLSDETLLVPAEFLPVLEERGLLPELDRRVLVRSAAIVRHLSARGSDALVSCNLSPASLARPGFLRDAGRLLDEAPELAARLVLEVPQRCWRMLDAEQAGVLGQLRERGLAFALDGATDMRIDPLALADRGVRYVKLPAEMLLEPGARRGLDVEVSDLAAVLSRAGISLVAERVEREEDVPNLLDLDVPLAQGFVFSPPRPVRAEVLEGPSASPAAPVPASASEPEKPNPQEPEAEKLRPPPPAAEGRRSFRSFLRRAG